jgi:hypothetical protein
MISVQVVTPLTLKAPSANSVQMAQIGGAALQAMLQRVERGVNRQDRQAKPYSPRGPIYVANPEVQGRTKSGLKGCTELTMPDRMKIRLVRRAIAARAHARDSVTQGRGEGAWRRREGGTQADCFSISSRSEARSGAWSKRPPKRRSL